MEGGGGRGRGEPRTRRSCARRFETRVSHIGRGTDVRPSQASRFWGLEETTSRYLSSFLDESTFFGTVARLPDVFLNRLFFTAVRQSSF